jgi:predicted SnoaL-like aldol condensation-catalyzing enzyme
MEDPIVFAASKSDPDTMYYHQAMKQPDAKQFRAALQKEIGNHMDNGHWEMMLKSEVPEGTKILDSVWAMKRK